MSKKVKFRTFEQMCLEKLEEIEPATRKDWAIAMGYKDSKAMFHVFKKLSPYIEKVNNGRPAKYKVKKGIINKMESVS